MGKRIGTLLEKNMEKIFRLAGFNTKRNTRLEGYEIDVLAWWNETRIIIQCKQYERSRLNLADVIHEWNSKNQIIKVDKVIIVVFGQDVEGWQRELANQLNITLWGEPEIDEAETIAINKGTNSLGEILGMLNLKKSIEDVPIRSKEKDLMNVVKVFGIIFLLIITITIPLLLIVWIIIFIVWVVKNKKKTLLKNKRKK